MSNMRGRQQRAVTPEVSAKRAEVYKKLTDCANKKGVSTKIKNLEDYKRLSTAEVQTIRPCLVSLADDAYEAG
jgi:hypothetical protein